MATVQPLQFNEATNNQGLCQHVDFLCKSDTNSFSLEDKARSINLALDEVAALIQEANDWWTFDDFGQTDLPVGTTDTVVGQADYAIDTSFINIKGVYFKDTSGFYREGTPVRARIAMEQDSSDSGLPYRYYLSGNSIFIDPIPDTIVTDGIKIEYERNIIYFATDATTATAGFNPQFHKILIWYAVRDFSTANNKPALKAEADKEIQLLSAKIKKYYARRNKTHDLNMQMAVDNYE